MTTASSTDWRVSIRHVPRTRLSHALGQLLCRAFSCQPSFTLSPEDDGTFDPLNMRWAVTFHHGWAIPTRFPRRLQLVAPAEIQGGDYIRWRVLNHGGAEVGQVLWNPDAGTFDNQVYPGLEVPQVPPPTERRQMLRGNRDPRRVEEARGHAWLQEDEQAGRMFGVGAIAVAQMALDRSLTDGQLVRINESYVRQMLQAWTHFPFLSRTIRYNALWLVGETAGPRGLAALDRLRQLYRAERELPLPALESWCLERARHIGLPLSDTVDTPEGRVACTVNMLRAASAGMVHDELFNNGIRLLVRERDHQALVEHHRRRHGHGSGHGNPCAEIALPGGQQQCTDMRGLSALGRLLVDTLDADTQRQILLNGWNENNTVELDASPIPREEWASRVEEFERAQRAASPWAPILPDQVRPVGEPIPSPIQVGTRIAVNPDGTYRPARENEEAFGLAMSAPFEDGTLRIHRSAPGGGHMVVGGNRPAPAPPVTRDRRAEERQRTLVRTLGTTTRQIVDVDAKDRGLEGVDLLRANVTAAILAMFDNMRPNVPMAAGLDVRVEALRTNYNELEVTLVDKETGRVFLNVRVDNPDKPQETVVVAPERAIDL